MNKIAFCLSGVLVLISFSWFLLISTLANIPSLYGDVNLFFGEATYTVPFWASIVGIVAGLSFCKHFYNKDKI